MKASEKPEFESDTHKRLYRHVEQRGAIDAETVRSNLDFDLERYHSAVSDLKQRGYLEETNGVLRLALNTGTETTHSSDGIEYTIRPARQEDLDGIIKVVRRITGEGTYVVAETVFEQLRYEETVHRHTETRSRVFFVATVDDSIIGWTHLDTSPMETLRHTAQQTVGVLDVYRGYGIGSQLMERGLEWALSNDYRKVYNSLPSTNVNALNFLEAHGWETEAIRRNHYRIDGELVDEVMMAVYPEAKTELFVP